MYIFVSQNNHFKRHFDDFSKLNWRVFNLSFFCIYFFISLLCCLNNCILFCSILVFLWIFSRCCFQRSQNVFFLLGFLTTESKSFLSILMFEKNIRNDSRNEKLSFIGFSSKTKYWKMSKFIFFFKYYNEILHNYRLKLPLSYIYIIHFILLWFLHFPNV